MKFLVDNALSPYLALRLKAGGFPAEHVMEVGLGQAPDSEIFRFARTKGFTIITADTDFGTAHAMQWTQSPSVILFRGDDFRSPVAQADSLLTYLPVLEPDLNQGAIVVFRRDRIRVRHLPLFE